VDVIGFGLLFLLFNELLRVTGRESVNDDDDNDDKIIIIIILITVLTNRINNHLLRNNILPEDRKAVAECIGDVKTNCW
jgi:hypothetical protein